MFSTLFRTAALSALLLLAACDRQSGSTATPTADLPQTLRVYTVPAERAESLRNALAGALGDNGRVELAPPDRLIVVAPVVLQTSVAENLGDLTKAAAPAAADPGPVRIVAWVVDVADAATVDPRLQPLQSTLEAVRETLAAPGFTLYGQVALTGSVGVRAFSQRAGDRRVELNVRLAPAEGGVLAEFNIGANHMQLNTETRLKFGETVVLAQAMPEEEGASRVRLVIVRADLAN
ncbi:MAG: hypothetical protein IPO66_12445 [Rhodanobacteraceae bacterium]|nr:hypothetical protein [Rhodanobacteraceae bacterium]